MVRIEHRAALVGVVQRERNAGARHGGQRRRAPGYRRVVRSSARRRPGRRTAGSPRRSRRRRDPAPAGARAGFRRRSRRPRRQQPFHPLQVGVGPGRHVQQVDERVGVAVVGQQPNGVGDLLDRGAFGDVDPDVGGDGRRVTSGGAGRARRWPVAAGSARRCARRPVPARQPANRRRAHRSASTPLR